MPINKIDVYLLEIGTEDLSRLWEICNVLCADMKYDRSDPVMLAHAQRVLRQYLEWGWVEIYYDDSENATEQSRPAWQITGPGEIEKIIQDPSNWVPGRFREGGYGYLTTAKGEAVLDEYYGS